MAKYIIDKHNELKKSIIKENLYNAKVHWIISLVFDLVEQICMAVLMILIIFSVIGGKLLVGSAVALLRVCLFLHGSFFNTVRC